MLIPLGQFFYSNIGIMARKVLGSLGIGVLSFAAITVAFEVAESYARTNYDSLPADVLALVGLAGIGEALGLITGAMAFRIGIATTSKLGVIPK